MYISIPLLPTDFAFLERYLPQLASVYKNRLLGDETVLPLTREEAENLQKALGEVLMAYGFDENYDENAVGLKVVGLRESISDAVRG